VSTAAVHVQARGQKDAVLHRHRAMGERGNEQLIPACERRCAGHKRQFSKKEKSVLHGSGELVSPCWLQTQLTGEMGPQVSTLPLPAARKMQKKTQSVRKKKKTKPKKNTG